MEFTTITKRMKGLRFAIILTAVHCCCILMAQPQNQSVLQAKNGISLIVLGTLQDGGSPHIGCEKDCCKALFKKHDDNRKVVSLGVVDQTNKQSYLFEATPDITEQIKMLASHASVNDRKLPDGIFLTHAHIGHYSGLMYLGKEALNAVRVPVYAMPLMKQFLETNGPWSQLVNNKNIVLNPIQNETPVLLNNQLQITPFKVPHRDEYSETVGYTIGTPNKKVLFIPDIDKWKKWKKDIQAEIAKVDLAFIDATFFDALEINNRDISEIPHPFVIESLEIFKAMPQKEKSKIYFIHFNHTNPALNPRSAQTRQILSAGFNIARIGQTFTL